MPHSNRRALVLVLVLVLGSSMLLACGSNDEPKAPEPSVFSDPSGQALHTSAPLQALLSVQLVPAATGVWLTAPGFGGLESCPLAR